MASRTAVWPGGATAQREREVDPAWHAHRSNRSLAARPAVRAPSGAAPLVDRSPDGVQDEEQDVEHRRPRPDGERGALRRLVVDPDAGRVAAGAVLPGRERRRRLAQAADSTQAQSAFASRICSTVRQFASSSRGRADEVREALRPRDRDVQPVPREEEVEPARDVLAARARHRVEDDRRLLALELVHGADADSLVRDLLAQAADVRVVRRDDDRRPPARARARRRSSHVRRAEQPLDLRRDRLRLLRRLRAGGPRARPARKRIPFPSCERPLERRPPPARAAPRRTSSR